MTVASSPAGNGPRSFAAVLFDLDGTLLDSIGDLADSMNAALQRAALPTHPGERYKHFVGEGVRRLVYLALPADLRDDESIVDRFVGEMVAEYRDRWDRTSRPYPGVAEMLDALQARRLPLAILSNKPDEFTRKIAERIFDRWRFAVVRGSLPDVPRKPDPTAALAIAQLLEVAPAAVAYLGDTAIDMRTAAAAGMYGVGVLWGFRDERELRQGGARLLIDHPSQALDLLVETMG